MTALLAKVIALETPGDQYQVIVQINTRSTGARSILSLLERSNPTAALLRTAG
jgi:hypothetical protein